MLLTADVPAKTHELSSKHADLCLVHGFASVAHCSFCALLLGFDCGFSTNLWSVLCTKLLNNAFTEKIIRDIYPPNLPVMFVRI